MYAIWNYLLVRLKGLFTSMAKLQLVAVVAEYIFFCFHRVSLISSEKLTKNHGIAENSEQNDETWLFSTRHFLKPEKYERIFRTIKLLINCCWKYFRVYFLQIVKFAREFLILHFNQYTAVWKWFEVVNPPCNPWKQKWSRNHQLKSRERHHHKNQQFRLRKKPKKPK